MTLRKIALFCTAFAFCTSMIAAAAPVVRETREASTLTWQPMTAWTSARLTIDGPDGFYYSKSFQTSSPLSVNVREAGAVRDGQYTYELVLGPPVDAATMATIRQAEERGDVGALLDRLAANGKLPIETAVYSDSFVILNGSVVSRDLVEPTASPSGSRPAAMTASVKPSPFHPDDDVVADDEIVQGSLCVGLDCVNNESFGFDTIRLKENNTRIHFLDDSTSVGFPANQWQLTANDSVSGGLNKFSIEDITNALVPFTVLAPAPTNSLFVDATGKVGFRTSTPALDLHILTSDTPAIRLDQSNAGGFTPQAWDIAGNEANFFIRDVTAGFKLPFRIRPGAPTSSIDIAATGKVGMGTASPAAALEVSRADGTAAVRLTNSGTSTSYTIAGPPASGSSLNIFDATTPASTKVGIGSSSAPQYTLDVTGDVRITGNLIANIPSPLKSGIVTPAQFSGTPPTVTVTFATAFPNTSYVIGLTPVSNSGKLVFNVLSKTAAGFKISSDKPINGLQELDWIATAVHP